MVSNAGVFAGRVGGVVAVWLIPAFGFELYAAFAVVSHLIAVRNTRSKKTPREGS